MREGVDRGMQFTERLAVVRLICCSALLVVELACPYCTKLVYVASLNSVGGTAYHGLIVPDAV